MAGEPHQTFEQRRMALEARVSQATGTDADNPVTRSISEMAGVGARYADSVKNVFEPPKTPDGRGWDKMTKGEKAVAALHKAQEAAGAVMGAMGVLQDMVDVGFAN